VRDTPEIEQISHATGLVEIRERCYEASRELVERPLSRAPRWAPLTTRPRAQDNNTRAYGLLHRLADEENLPDAQFNLG
jgi:hypothetical protein